MASETTKEKRTSLTRRLIILTGFVIVALNVVQLLFVTTNAKKDIVAEDLAMYENMMDGYSAALQNDLTGYYRALNAYIHSDAVTNGCRIPSTRQCTVILTM